MQVALIQRAGGWLRHTAITLAMLVGIAGCATYNQRDEQADPVLSLPQVARVWVQGDTVYYKGGLSEDSSVVFDAAVSGIMPGQVTRLVISSGGGDTVAGRHIGRWVHSMGVVVEVEGICFSSCADYIFPAARARIIREDAFIGWHGNERQFEVLAARNGTSVAQEIERILPSDMQPDDVPAFVKEVEDKLRVTRPDETDFYAKLGLNDAFAVCAVGDVLEKRQGVEGHKGWGFSLSDMERFGMANTVYLGKGIYEKDSTRFRRYLWLMSADECLAFLK